MLLRWACAFLLLLGPCLSSNIAAARGFPRRELLLGPSKATSSFSPQPTADTGESLPLSTVVVLKIPWIKEFLAFDSSLQTKLTAQALPLTSKFTNYDDTSYDDSDLRAWTRYVVNNANEDDNNISAAGNVSLYVDLDIDRFIRYLVEHRGFKESDLAFLRRAGLDHGYEQIEDELSKLHDGDPHNIDIGGEENGGQRFSLNVVTFVALLALVL